MIIFNFGPFSKDELTVRFDREGALIFLGVASNFLNQRSDPPLVDCLQCIGTTVNAAKIEIKRGESNQLEKNGNRLIFCMSNEALEYAIFLLEEFIANGDFSPAEFYSFSRRNRKYETQIFFLKFSSIEECGF